MHQAALNRLWARMTGSGKEELALENEGSYVPGLGSWFAIVRGVGNYLLCCLCMKEAFCTCSGMLYSFIPFFRGEAWPKLVNWIKLFIEGYGHKRFSLLMSGGSGFVPK